MGEGFYLGKRTDLLDHCPKAEGMLMLLRTMTPKILAADEIGGKEDMKALAYVRNCGCKLLMTIHGSSLQDLFFRPVVGKYFKQFPFERYIYLEKGKKAERKFKKKLCQRLSVRSLNSPNKRGNGVLVFRISDSRILYNNSPSSKKQREGFVYMRNKERSCYGKIIRCMFYPYGFLSFWSKDYGA